MNDVQVSEPELPNPKPAKFPSPHEIKPWMESKYQSRQAWPSPLSLPAASHSWHHHLHLHLQVWYSATTPPRRAHNGAITAITTIDVGSNSVTLSSCASITIQDRQLIGLQWCDERMIPAWPSGKRSDNLSERCDGDKGEGESHLDVEVWIWHDEISVQ